MGFSSAAMFVVVLENDHHVICTRKQQPKGQRTSRPSTDRYFSHRFVDSVLVRVDADEVELDAAVEHALLLGCEGAVAFEEKTRVGEEALLLAAECSEDSRRQANM